MKELSVAYAFNPCLGRLRPEDLFEFKASHSYIVKTRKPNTQNSRGIKCIKKVAAQKRWDQGIKQYIKSKGLCMDTFASRL